MGGTPSVESGERPLDLGLFFLDDKEVLLRNFFLNF